VLKVQIIAALAILTCGQILFWRRRDNVFGYFQAGLFIASVLIPILGTTVLDDADPEITALYARILTIGAPAYLVGLWWGGHLGLHARSPSLTFSRRFDTVPVVLVRRARIAAVVAVVALLAAFALLGYVPALAGDRLAAKFGVGPYRAGFTRGAQVFHLAMGLASAVAGVLLALVAVRRRTVEVVLLGALLVGLAATLSRGEALIGPLTFLIAWGIQKRWRPVLLLGAATMSFLGATLANELLFATGPAPVATPSFAVRVTQTAPDVLDHLAFLNGYRLTGEERVGTKTLQAGYSLSLSKGYWDPADYALRIRTGLSDVGELAAGGLRLPAPFWGYVSFGSAGAVVWSWVAGVFIGWGTTMLRRHLTDVEEGRFPNQALNLVLAWVFFNGTFAVLGQFYFPFRSDILIVILALALGLAPVRHQLEARREHAAQQPTS
jgi:hypothetical protein